MTALAALVVAASMGQAVPSDPFAGMPGIEQAVPVSGELSSMGAPVSARAWKVKLAPDAAIAWVIDAYRRAGLYVPGASGQFQVAGAPQLTGYDHAARRSYTAIFRPAGKGHTLIITGTADLSGEGWAKPVASALPALPGAVGPLESRSEGTTQLAYGVRATPVEVDDFYRQVLPAAGWAASEPGTWVRRGEQLTVTHAPRGPTEQGVVVTLRPLPPATAGPTR
jgi:hypothetical protein